MLSVEVTPRAAAQIERAARWWTENRPAAPGAIADEFEEAKSLLAAQPGVGARSSSQRHPELRRLYLSRIRYHLYYRVAPGKSSCLLSGTPAVEPAPSSDAHYAFAPLSFITFPSRGTSALTIAASWSGGMPLSRAPSRLCASGIFRILSISVWSRSMIGFGVPAGANTACH